MSASFRIPLVASSGRSCMSILIVQYLKCNNKDFPVPVSLLCVCKQLGHDVEQRRRTVGRYVLNANPARLDPALRNGPLLTDAPLHKLKVKICEHLGRQDAAMLKVACGLGTQRESIDLDEALLREPFTYWGWNGSRDDRTNHISWEGESHSLYGYHNTQCHDEKWKRRLIWEHERGFRANGIWSQSPTPQQRWEMFKSRITRLNRKRIAVSYWMTHDDVKWIAEYASPTIPISASRQAHSQSYVETCSAISNLTSLEGLDLSHDFLNLDAGYDDGHPANNWLQQWNTLLRSDHADIAFGFAQRRLQPDDLDYFTCFESDKDKEDIKAQLHELCKSRSILRHDFIQEHSYEALLSFAKLQEEMLIIQNRLLQRQKIRDQGNDKIDGPLKRIIQSLENTFLSQLNWIGIPDWRAGKYANRGILRFIVSRCEKLEIFSIRNKYSFDCWIDGTNKNAHADICTFITEIQENAPQSVTTIELRLHMAYLEWFMTKLTQVRPNIKSVGIDLGAWVQMYPLRKRNPEGLQKLSDYGPRGIKAHTSWYAQAHIHDIYRKHHIMRLKGLAQPTPWVLPRYMAFTHRKGSSVEDDDCRWESEYKRKHLDFYSENQGSKVPYRILPGHSEVLLCGIDPSEGHRDFFLHAHDSFQSTLSKMLRYLYHISMEVQGLALIPLDPEPQARSTYPIHPFALTQQETAVRIDVNSTASYLPEIEEEHYRWLNQIFKWRPMVKSQMPGSLDTEAFQYYESYNHGYSIKLIEKEFRSLKAAGIPIHVLIGRRKREGSSCYWGLLDEWNADEHYDSNLYNNQGEDEDNYNIAALVDTLSIYYDLRNPLAPHRLAEIEVTNPYKGPHAQCPSRPCLWRSQTGCPFSTQRQPPIVNKHQPMANKKPLRPRVLPSPRGNDSLAPYSAYKPPTGENANDFTSDDSESDSNGKTPLASRDLHHLARRIVFSREAVGWQRFWNQYALRFTNLKELHVRMPRSFDKIFSARLSRLLAAKGGWWLRIFTNERQHTQTHEDTLHHPFEPEIYEHLAAAKVIPAGYFIRRSWFRKLEGEVYDWMKIKSGEPQAGTRLLIPVAEPGIHLTQQDWDETAELEQRALASAMKRTQNAEKDEEDYEEKYVDHDLQEKGLAQRPEAMGYARHIRTVARQAWRGQLGRYIALIRDEQERNGQTHSQAQRDILEATQKQLEEEIEEDPYGHIFMDQPRRLDVVLNGRLEGNIYLKPALFDLAQRAQHRTIRELRTLEQRAQVQVRGHETPPYLQRHARDPHFVMARPHCVGPPPGYISVFVDDDEGGHEAYESLDDEDDGHETYESFDASSDGTARTPDQGSSSLLGSDSLNPESYGLGGLDDDNTVVLEFSPLHEGPMANLSDFQEDWEHGDDQRPSDAVPKPLDDILHSTTTADRAVSTQTAATHGRSDKGGLAKQPTNTGGTFTQSQRKCPMAHLSPGPKRKRNISSTQLGEDHNDGRETKRDTKRVKLGDTSGTASHSPTSTSPDSLLGEASGEIAEPESSESDSLFDDPDLKEGDVDGGQGPNEYQPKEHQSPKTNSSNKKPANSPKKNTRKREPDTSSPPNAPTRKRQYKPAQPIEKDPATSPSTRKIPTRRPKKGGGQGTSTSTNKVSNRNLSKTIKGSSSLSPATDDLLPSPPPAHEREPEPGQDSEPESFPAPTKSRAGGRGRGQGGRARARGTARGARGAAGAVASRATGGQLAESEGKSSGTRTTRGRRGGRGGRARGGGGMGRATAAPMQDVDSVARRTRSRMKVAQGQS